jgi:hypothetical protein
MSVLSIVLFALAVVAWIGTVSLAATLNNSDGAGNGLSYSFGVLFAGGLWVLLAGLTLSVGMRGVIPRAGAFAAVVLIPASGAAAVAAINLLRVRAGAGNWPIVIPALAPLLVLGYLLWASYPGIRALLSERLATGIVWGIVLILALAPWPLVRAVQQGREAERARIREERQ